MELQVNQELSCISSQDADVIIRTAKIYPRDTRQCILDIIAMATIDDETASSCIYSKPTGGSTVSGPSVRLAEIAFSCWGNVRSAQRPVGFSQDGKSIIAEAICWDCEKNTLQSVQVQRSIIDKYGNKYKPDMINTTISAASSVAFRNSVFKVIPKVIIDQVYLACVNKSLGKSDDSKKTDLPKRANNVLQRLEGLGVERIKVFSFFGVKNEQEINQEMIVQMVGAGTAIKDGSLSLKEAFSGECESLVAPSSAHTSKANALADRLSPPLPQNQG